MNAYGSAPSSAVPSISDLDGYTLRDYQFPMSSSYAPAEQDEFGFDPPSKQSHKIEQTYTPPDLNGWPGFEREEDKERMKQGIEPAYEIDKLISQTLPNATNAISRYGQVTPPRTNSATSADSILMHPKEESSSPRTSTSDRRKKAKQQPKQEPVSNTVGRKRKNARKSVASVEEVSTPEDAKRKASLEKNRLAAAKCRINKKEKTEQLQRDSHDKAVHNAFLKDQIMRMKEEIQQMNAILLSHANCEGCKSPEEIQKHLNHLGGEFLSQQMMSGQHFDEYPHMQLGDMPSHSEHMMQDDYFSSLSPDQMNPPLPEFNRNADFEVHTPMHTD